MCGGCTTRGVPERLVQFGAVHLRLLLLQEAAKCGSYMNQQVLKSVLE